LKTNWQSPGIIFFMVSFFMAALVFMPSRSGALEDTPSPTELINGIDSIKEIAGTLSSPEVLVLTINGPIGPVTAEYAIKGMRDAVDNGASFILIELDTPGGLMDSMRDIIKEIIGSPVPVAVYVSPGGARAASAGAFITIAAHIAAMTPESNIGAAHPVNAGGGQMDETMAGKVENDAAAYIRSLAKMRGRNVKWAESAVRNSVSITADEALRLNVIDIVSPDLPSLLDSLDGREVMTAKGSVRLSTKDIKVTRVRESLRHRLLNLITNPNVAYILMILGIYGLFFEMTNPGAIFPGVVGGICIILAFYSFQTLPVNYAGLLLILLAAVLFILETQIVSHGALAMGGIVAMFFGSLMLFDKAAGGQFVSLSINLVILTTLITAAFFIIAVRFVIKAHRGKPSTGQEGLMGEEGTALTDINEGGGQVFVHGEHWSAFSDEPIAKDAKVSVESISGLKIKVVQKNKGG